MLSTHEQQRIDQIMQRINGASTFPWRIDMRQSGEDRDEAGAKGSVLAVVDAATTEKVVCWMGSARGHGKADADFITHAQDDILWLLHLVARAQRAIATGDALPERT